MNKIRIPANVAMLAGKKVSVNSSIDEEYKEFERPLNAIGHELDILKKNIDDFYKEANEAWKDLHAHKEPVVSDKYINGDYIKSLEQMISRLEDAIENYASIEG